MFCDCIIIKIIKTHAEGKLLKKIISIIIIIFILCTALCACDGSIIYSVENDDVLENEAEPILTNSAVHAYDLENATCRRLCELPIRIEMTDGWLNDGKLYFVGADAAEQDTLVFPEQCAPYIKAFEHQKLKLIFVDTETGEMQIIAGTEREQAHWYQVMNGYVFGTVYTYDDSKLEPGVYVYDLTGAQAAFIPAREDTPNIGVNYIFGDFVFGAVNTNDASDTKSIEYMTYHGPEWYFKLSEIGSGSIEWHKWEP